MYHEDNIIDYNCHFFSREAEVSCLPNGIPASRGPKKENAKHLSSSKQNCQKDNSQQEEGEVSSPQAGFNSIYTYSTVQIIFTIGILFISRKTQSVPPPEKTQGWINLSFLCNCFVFGLIL